MNQVELSATAKSSFRPVLLASHAYLPVTGGVENSLYHLAVSYAEQGHDVHIVCSDVGYESGFDDRGLTVTRLSTYGSFGIIGRIYRTWRWWRSEYQAKPTQLIIARHHLSVWYAWLAGFRDIVYLVPSVFVYEYAKPKSLIGQFKYTVNCSLQKTACQLANKVAVFSDNMQEQLASIGITDIKRVLPGVNSNRFCHLDAQAKASLRTDISSYFVGGKAADRAEWNASSPILLCVGRLVDNKGVHLVLEALQSIPDARLLIIGTGEKQAALQAQAVSLGIDERVAFVGQTTQPEQFYQLADVFVFASLYEPFGQTLLEAGASELPIVAFRPSAEVRTATDKVLPDDAVTWVEQPTSLCLAQGLTQLLRDTNTQRRCSRKAHQYVIEHYTWQSLASRLLLLSQAEPKVDT